MFEKYITITYWRTNVSGYVFFIGVPTLSLYVKFISKKSRLPSWTYIKGWLLITQVKIIRSQWQNLTMWENLVFLARKLSNLAQGCWSSYFEELKNVVSMSIVFSESMLYVICELWEKNTRWVVLRRENKSVFSWCFYFVIGKLVCHSWVYEL